MTGWTRWLKFNGVGALGIVAQLGMLALLNGVFHVQYLIATAIAVESAVLHNFVWHERFRGRPQGQRTFVPVAEIQCDDGRFLYRGKCHFLKTSGGSRPGATLSECLCHWLVLGYQLPA